MDPDAFKTDIAELSSTLDDLENSLKPLLNSPVSTNASKIPLLDKAKLYTLITYAIESLLFSSVRLNGVEAKDHAVYKELARIKQYFDKVKSAEDVGVKPSSKLDKAAANRFIKHALAGNDKQGQTGMGGWSGTKRKLDEQDVDAEREVVDEAKGSKDSSRRSSQDSREKDSRKSSKKHKSHKSRKAPRGAHAAFEDLVKENTET